MEEILLFHDMPGSGPRMRLLSVNPLRDCLSNPSPMLQGMLVPQTGRGPVPSMHVRHFLFVQAGHHPTTPAYLALFYISD